MTAKTQEAEDHPVTLLADGSGQARLRKPTKPAVPEPQPEPPPQAPPIETLSFEQWLQKQHPDLPLQGVAAVLRLAGEGATLPFIARYRKEQTGNLDEVAIQKALDAKQRWDRIVARQAFVLQAIEHQKKLTPELKARILSAFDLDALEDLYLPYKQKRKTKATLAHEAGLEPLADWIWDCGHGTEQPQPGQTLEIWAFTFRNEALGIGDAEAAIQGAQDILTERLAETAELRQLVRETTFRKGCVKTLKGKKAKPNSKFEKYFEYHEPIAALLRPQSSHRYLAVRRGSEEGELRLAIAAPPDDPSYEEALIKAFEATACTVPESPGAEVLRRAARAALKDYVRPSIESEAHRALKEAADRVAIGVFADNLRNLLLASPFGSKAVLGIDPGQRTGCKLAAIEDSGKYLASEVLQLQNEAGQQAARQLLEKILQKVPVRAIAVGNGTAGRETEAFVRKALKEMGLKVPVVLVNEAGASVYSASRAAREEFPDLDITVRGAISIARRLQDPLAELVKIDPKSIGVGQYQHDVAAASLKRSLDQVVESCVNQVGANLNTASYHLLSHVSGIGPALAKAIVGQRASKGLFGSRQELLAVPRFSKKSFELSAGFLRVPESDNPLDNTGVHPERYAALEALAGRLGRDVKDFVGSDGVALVRQDAALREELGPYTYQDVVKELEKPGRDPREEFVPFQYRDDVHEIADLKPGMKCPGIVTNVTNFGAFVDIGVHHDGLVHVSQLSNHFVKDPREVVHPGMRVEVRVLEVNLEKKQLGLSMKREPPKRAAPPKPRQAEKKPQDRKPGGQPRGPQRRKEPAARRGQSRPPSPARPSAHVPLNNPFAVLADLKKTLKPKR